MIAPASQSSSERPLFQRNLVSRVSLSQASPTAPCSGSYGEGTRALRRICRFMPRTAHPLHTRKAPERLPQRLYHRLSESSPGTAGGTFRPTPLAHSSAFSDYASPKRSASHFSRFNKRSMRTVQASPSESLWSVEASHWTRC